MPSGAPPPFWPFPPWEESGSASQGLMTSEEPGSSPPESLFPLGMDDEGPPGIDCWGGTPEEPDTVLGPLFLEDVRNLSP